MKITPVSDLHLEFSTIELTNTQNADVLILSGDIMIAEDLYNHPAIETIYEYGAFADLGRKQQNVLNYRNFLKNVSEKFPHVIYIAGNHEFYHGKWNKTFKYLRDECAKYSNIHFLENEVFELDDVVFIGNTLWTDMNNHDPLTLHSVRDMMNDFHLIRNDEKNFRRLTPEDTVIRHRKALDYIKNVIVNLRHANTNKKVVVVGHHAPTSFSIAPEYVHDTLMNGAYCSNLGEFILNYPEIVVWTHGHMHRAISYTVGSTQIICNPRGYESTGHSENTGWNPNLVIEI